MSITTTTRQASIDEIAAEMDRRGKAIEHLEESTAYWKGAYERMAARNINLDEAVTVSVRALEDLAAGRGLFKPIEQIIAEVRAKAVSS